MHECAGQYLIRTYTQPSLIHDPTRTEALVLVESRPSFWLKYVVANAVRHNPDANLYVFGTPDVFRVLDSAMKGTYTKLPLPGRFGSASDFSKLLLSPEFWNVFHEKFVIVFQLDAVFIRSLRSEFFAYDFIGAACGSLQKPVFNGGFSLRRRDAMITAISLMDPATRNLPEDVAFSKTMRARPDLFTLPTLEKACEFAFESIGNIHKVVGIHGVDKLYAPYCDIKAIIDASEAETWPSSMDVAMHV